MQEEWDYCQCKIQEIENNKIKVKNPELYEKMQTYRNQVFNTMMPQWLYYIMLSNNLLMLISFLFSPILIYYAKSLDKPIYSPCFKFYELFFLMIFLIINTTQKFFLLEKLNSNTCCVDKLEKMLRGIGHDLIQTNKLKKNFRKFITIYTFMLVVIISSTIYLIILNFKNKVMTCSDDDFLGYIVTRMILFSSCTGCLFNILEFKLLNSLIARIMNRNSDFNFLSLFNCFEICSKESKHNQAQF